MWILNAHKNEYRKVQLFEELTKLKFQKHTNINSRGDFFLKGPDASVKAGPATNIAGSWYVSANPCDDYDDGDGDDIGDDDDTTI